MDSKDIAKAAQLAGGMESGGVDGVAQVASGLIVANNPALLPLQGAIAAGIAAVAHGAENAAESPEMHAFFSHLVGSLEHLFGFGG